MLDESLIEYAAHRFALLGDPTRLRILRVLMSGRQMSVGAVAEAAHTSRFNASAHLNRLAQGGLVARRQEGTTRYYTVADAGLAQVCDWVCAGLPARAPAPAGARGDLVPT
jgi:DNA-binding transcriptional ArsR family regulator